MSQLKHVVDPFGEVNVYPAAGGKVRVVATILMEPHREGAQTGIALDGSGSMSKLYGVEDGSRVLSPIFGGPKKLHNEITPIAQKLCAYLARRSMPMAAPLAFTGPLGRTAAKSRWSAICRRRGGAARLRSAARFRYRHAT